ncbi:TetR/AcrR family transcriptional regulator [Stenotrophomonas maltophilia]|uniref:TetR/AcrR family transcriptional regulator n=1 Tax=Stenotrophomonas maltophilia TaxID=40324 RepID=UPI002893F0C0|nr:TetR/AcrR family transcriptional regulator [Stenotrophomonas maltophilia]MDT3430797.1 TetR/AcrR family transcriptional regulator [Stenotrophomonas maltophilia]
MAPIFMTDVILKMRRLNYDNRPSNGAAMSLRQPDSRQRVVVAAAEMLARHGLNATSIREMVKRAQAPFGSTYHHFPGGKHQVISEAVVFAGERVQRQLENHLCEGVRQGLPAFLDFWREILLRSDFRQGCPVMAAVVEEPIDGEVLAALEAASQTFGHWRQILSASLRSHGHTAIDASQLATLIVASIEGAIVLCRAERSIAPFDHVARQLEFFVQTNRS